MPPESDDDNFVGDDEFPEEDDDLSLHGLDDEPDLDVPAPSKYSAGMNMCVVSTSAQKTFTMILMLRAKRCAGSDHHTRRAGKVIQHVD